MSRFSVVIARARALAQSPATREILGSSLAFAAGTFALHFLATMIEGMRERHADLEHRYVTLASNNLALCKVLNKHLFDGIEDPDMEMEEFVRRVEAIVSRSPAG